MSVFFLVYLILGFIWLLLVNPKAQEILGSIVGAAFVIATWPLFLGGGLAAKLCGKLKK